MSKAEDVNVSNGNELIEAIKKVGTNTANLQNNITATGNLGNLAGTQLTIDGGENKYGISGIYQENGEEKYCEGITVGSEQKLIVDNVGFVATDGIILNSWNGFARSVTDSSAAAKGGAISNESGIVEISNSIFSKNCAVAAAAAAADAKGGAISNESGIVEISNSIFFNNYAAAAADDAAAYAYARGGAIYNNGTLTITNSIFSNNGVYVYAAAAAYGGAIYNNGTLTITNSIFFNNYAAANANANAYGGAIYNGSGGTVEITDSSFSNNSASAYGGAIYNQEGDVNIIASTKDSVFSGNYIKVNGRKTNNDIYNFGTLELPGTINLYAASDKTISFDGGIVSEVEISEEVEKNGASSVNINVKGETDYNVAGTVLFKTGSINSDNNFTLGAGTLKLESGVSQNWLNNSLTQTGGTLDLANGVIETTALTTLNSTGGSLILDIDFTAGTADQIMVGTEAQIANGTLTNAIEIGGFNVLNGATTGTTKTFNVGNGAKITGTLSWNASNENNYVLTTARQSTTANSIDVTYGQQSLNDAISDSSAGDHVITLVGNTTPTDHLGDLAGRQLTIDGGEDTKFGISGNYETNAHYEGITVGSGQKLIVKNVGSVDANGNILNSWNGFERNVTDADDDSGRAISNLGGTVEISNSSFSNNYATAYANADATANADARGGAIYNNTGTVEISNSSFSNNSANADAIANADAYSSVYGGAIYNNTGTVEISNSSFSNNSATATANAYASARGGAIYNQEGDVNIIASTKDSVFSGNYTEGNGRKTNNDIYNFGTLELPGTINLYAASDKTISFDGGIVSEGPSSFVNINVNGEGTTYNVAGTVLFKTGSINSDNNFTLGAGTLKLESGVSQNWLNNSLTQTGGTLDLANRVIEETAFTMLDSTGGTVILDIDLAMGRADEINVTGTLINAIEIGGFNVLNGTTETTKTFNVGNGAKITGTLYLAGSNQNNYFRTTAGQSTTANSIEVTYGQSLNDAISDSSAGNRKIELVGNTTPTANLGDLAGTQLTIDGAGHSISGTYQENGEEKHYEGITVGSGQKLIVKNVGSVATDGTILNSWNGFTRVVTSNVVILDDGGAIYNAGDLTITDSSFFNNFITVAANTDPEFVFGGAICNNGTVTITGSNFFNNSIENPSSSWAYGGAIYNHGTVTITGSNFSNNYSSSFIDFSAYARGGAIYNLGTVTITDSNFSKNYATATVTNSHALAYGGVIFNERTLTITGSNFSNNYATATGTTTDTEVSVYGGAICNDGMVTITDSNFSNNYASVVNSKDHIFAKGGAIYNNGTVNIIASAKNSVFLGNKTIKNGIEANNDIYNQAGTINFYAVSGKTISFDGGIVSNLSSSSVNINVKGTTTYDVDGTVLFKNGSINSDNNFTLGAGTLKIENGVSWEYNSLVMNGGTLDIGNSPGVLNYKGGALTLNEGANIYIDILGAQAGTQYDQIVFSNGADFILNGGKLNVNLGYDAQEGTLFEIMKDFSWSGTTFDENCVEVLSAPEGWSSDRYFVASLGEGRGDKRSLFLEVIPEPSAVGLFAGSLAFTLVGMRRRKK